MAVVRGLLVLGMLVAVGLAVVALRGESAKSAYRVQRLHQRQLALEQALWAREMHLARLRGPDEIRRRTGELGLDVVPPATMPEQNRTEAGK